MSTKRLHCSATYFLDEKPRKISLFESGLPQLEIDNNVGPNGLSRAARDLVEISTLIYLLERNLPGNQQMNRVSKIDVRFGLRQPAIWTTNALQALQDVLFFMGGATWNFDFFLDRNLRDLPQPKTGKSSVQRVSLFSGGLDSLCGAATLRHEPDVRLVSYYTKQKTLQRRLAQGLDMPTPIQWGWKTRPPTGHGRSFRFRSFMYLCLAAAIAESYGANQILQFENGILASGIGPSLSYQTTKHAHYRVHRSCEFIFSEILGGNWMIDNPFQHCTKREAYQALISELGQKEARRLANDTETCWNLYAGFKSKSGKQKKNGVPCGFCVPCLIRGTALPQKTWLDLGGDAARNHPTRGRYFREYYGMLQRIQAVRDGTLGDFYTAMDTFLQDAVKPRGGYSLAELRDLFLRFSDEFMETYLSPAEVS